MDFQSDCWVNVGLFGPTLWIFTLQVDEPDDEPTDLTIWAAAADDAPPFPTTPATPWSG
jgi:hypothetical protein